MNYREEIEREFDDLKERLAARHAIASAAQATPLDVERALGRSEEASELVRIFERADYSLHKIGRFDYETFIKAKERAEQRAG